MARAKTTRPDSPRARAKKRSVTQRLTALESRMDSLELNVVARLNQFERVVLETLTKFGSEEFKGRNIFRALTISIGISIFVLLLSRMRGCI